MKGLVKVWVTTLPCRVLVKTKNVVIEEMRVGRQKLESLSQRDSLLSLEMNKSRYTHWQVQRELGMDIKYIRCISFKQKLYKSEGKRTKRFNLRGNETTS